MGVERMTDGPTFSFRHDPRWHEVPLAGDEQAWGHQAVRTAYDVAAREPSQAQLDSFGGNLAAMCGWVRTLAPALAFVFIPEPWSGPTALVLVEISPLPGSDTADGGSRAAALALLAVPDETLAEPPDVDDLDTGAGPAVRVRQRRLSTDGEGRRVVNEFLLYAWPDPERGLAIVASTNFPDLVEAGRWAGSVDDLARGMTFGDG
jgi:hypothetical protein